MRYLPLAALPLLLAACSGTTTTGVNNTIAGITPAVQTLADLASQDNHTVATILAGGAAICKTASGYIALAETFGSMTKYSSVVNATAGAVQAACAIASGVPTALPSSVPAASVPVVVLPAAAALKPAGV